jgi:hypothetical protein
MERRIAEMQAQLKPGIAGSIVRGLRKKLARSGGKDLREVVGSAK